MVWSSFAERWRDLRLEVERLRARDPDGYRTSPAAKLMAALRDAVLRDIPSDPGAARYRLGKAMGAEFSHWRHDKFFQRFRLFFRYSSRHRTIIYAWLNDDRTLRKEGARTDAYFVFRRMLERGSPPDDWVALARASEAWGQDDVDHVPGAAG